MEKISLCILGIDNLLDTFLREVFNSEKFSVGGIFSERTDIIDKYSERYPDITFFEDPRQMILNVPSCVVFWNYSLKKEIIRLALDMGRFLILRWPIKEQLRSYIDLIKQAEDKKVDVYVWVPWVYLPSYEAVGDWISDQQVRAVSFNVQLSSSFLEAFIRDSADLLLGSYIPLCLIQLWLGLPMYVYCREHIYSRGSSNASVQYFSSIVLEYKKQLGCVYTSVDIDRTESIAIISTDSYQIRADLNQASLYDRSGSLIEQSSYYELDQACSAGYRRWLDLLWQCIVGRRRLAGISLQDHIGALLMLEAAEVSSRTNQPELLAKVAELNDIASFPLTL